MFWCIKFKGWFRIQNHKNILIDASNITAHNIIFTASEQHRHIKTNINYRNKISYLLRWDTLVKEYLRTVHYINLCNCTSKNNSLNGIKENYSSPLFSERNVCNSRLHCDNLICESKMKFCCFFGSFVWKIIGISILCKFYDSIVVECHILLLL